MKIILTFNDEKELKTIKEIFDENNRSYELINKTMKLDITGFDYKKTNMFGFETIELIMGNHALEVRLKFITDIIIGGK